MSAVARCYVAVRLVAETITRVTVALLMAIGGVIVLGVLRDVLG